MERGRYTAFVKVRSAQLPSAAGPHCTAGLAVSSDGIRWQRGAGQVEGARGPERAADVGKVGAGSRMGLVLVGLGWLPSIVWLPASALSDGCLD